MAETLDVTYATVAAWRNGCRTKGLDCLYDAPRSGRPIVIDGAQRAQVTALAWSDAPEGHDRWTLRLLAEQVVEAGFCATISHTMVGTILKKRSEAPWTADLVLWHTQCGLSGPDGAHSGTLCAAV
ncbi:MAG: helix-turn-helix domain-containing protein [Roseiflexus sp.]|nr:helix-turn-helix domain-containing protein [Roseiflexus sp.]